MRKAFTILAALVLAFSFSFAQVSNNQMAKRVNKTTTTQEVNKSQANPQSIRTVDNLLLQSSNPKDMKIKQVHQNYRITGNPVWGQTMSYCLDGTFASAVGTNTTGDTVYWGIKIEPAALVGRNNVTDVMFYVYGAGNYTVKIYSGSNTGTPVATQSVTATTADEGAWKTVHLTTPAAITQGQDMWVILSNTDVTYPAAGVAGTQYDNGKYISLDGLTYDLITNLSSTLNYTWMIKVVSDTWNDVMPDVTMSGPAMIQAGDTATFTASSGNATSFTWNITADYTVSNGNTAQAMWQTAGVKQVVVGATNTAGTAYDTMDVTVYTCDGINTFPYNMGFENGMQCWTMVSIDPVNDNRFGLFQDASAYEGSYDFRFSSFSSASDYNQYLITPELTLPATGSYMVKFHYKGYNSNESFRVMTSSTTNAISSFTQLVDYPTVSTTWDEVAVVLPAGTKYVAINYYANYQYYLYVDAFSIESLSAPVATLAGPTAVEVGVPATFTVTTSPSADTYAWSVDGTAVTSTTDALTHTFTTAGNHTVQVIASNSIGSDTASMVVEAYICEAVTTFPYSYGFEDGLRCWTMIANDPANDSYFGVQEDGSYAYEGDYDFWFSSFYSASDYNQYLISPELQLPATSTYVVKFYYQGYSTADAFRVMTSSTTNAVSSFTQLADYPTVATDWTEVTLILPAGTKYVAINYYGDYQYVLYVDAFSIELMGAPTVTLNGPSSIGTGSPATFIANAPLATSFSWTVDGTAVSNTNNTLTHTFTAAGNHTVGVTATNSEGSSTATLTVNVFSCDAITTFPYNQDFEQEDVYGCWTLIDGDGDGINWDLDYLRGMEDDETGQGYGHNGSYGMAASASWMSSTGALNPDNWLITPALQLPNGNYKLNWYVKGQDPDYAAEYYAVYVSTTNDVNALMGTTPLYSGYATEDWVLKTVDLSAYAGQTVYVAFRHYNVSDMFYIDIDDISIALGTGIEDHDMNISVFPNPATNNISVIGDGIQEVQILDINGRTLMTFNEGGQLNIGKLADGMYLVRIVTENGVQMNKIIKK